MKLKEMEDRCTELEGQLEMAQSAAPEPQANSKKEDSKEDSKEERKRKLAAEKNAARLKKASKVKEDRRAARKEQEDTPVAEKAKSQQEEEDARIFKYVADRKAAAKDKHKVRSDELDDLMDDDL